MSSVNDSALSEIHDELYRQEEERPKGGYGALNQQTKFWAAIFGGILLFLISNNTITLQKGLLFGAIGALVLFMSQGEDISRKELTWIECMIRLYDQLKFVQQHPIGDSEQIPKGDIRIRPVGKKQWYDGKGFKRSYAVSFYDRDLDLEDEYFSEVDILTGDVITLRHAPEGVRGDEKKDIKLMPTADMRWEKKKDEYLGSMSKGKF